MNALQHGLIFAARVYQWVISPAKSALLGPFGRCRFSPTCSQYAIDAVRAHGALRGSALASWRLCRCHPWGGHGYDPVPRELRSGRAFLFYKPEGEATPHDEPATPHPGPLPYRRGEGEKGYRLTAGHPLNCSHGS